MYLLLTDGLIYKSRYFVIAFGFGFFAISIFNLYGNTFGNWNVGVVLAQYTIDGQSYTIMERSTQRAIYLQTLLLCVNALYMLPTEVAKKCYLYVIIYTDIMAQHVVPSMTIPLRFE